VQVDYFAGFGFTGDDMRRGGDTASRQISKDVEPVLQETHVCCGREGHLSASSIPDVFAACNTGSANAESCNSNPNVRTQHIALLTNAVQLGQKHPNG
jgi:hypothetical protein